MVFRIIVGVLVLFFAGVVFVFWGSLKLDQAAQLANRITSPIFSFETTFLSPSMSGSVSADLEASLSSDALASDSLISSPSSTSATKTPE